MIRRPHSHDVATALQCTSKQTLSDVMKVADCFDDHAKALILRLADSRKELAEFGIPHSGEVSLRLAGQSKPEIRSDIGFRDYISGIIKEICDAKLGLYELKWLDIRDALGEAYWKRVAEFVRVHPKFIVLGDDSVGYV